MSIEGEVLPHLIMWTRTSARSEDQINHANQIAITCNIVAFRTLCTILWSAAPMALSDIHFFALACLL